MTLKQEDRLRRFRAKGRWFLPNKKDKTLWLNHFFPVLLILSFLFYIINL